DHDRQRHSETVPGGQGLPRRGSAEHGADGDHPRRGAALHAGARHGGPGMTTRAMAEVGTAEPTKVKGSPKWGDVILRIVAGLVLLYLFLPIFVIVLFSFNDPKGKFNYSWQGFTLNN